MYINVINLSHFAKSWNLPCDCLPMNDPIVWWRYTNLTNGMQLSSTRQAKTFDQTLTWKVMDDDN
jgi:hypothetical protein